jgi:L-methionine (R)-S-oxide reductase
VPHYNWVGIYTMDPDQRRLDLLCLEGLPTEHISIPYGKGICGQVAESGEALFVDDVRLEDNYISCNVLVRSEVVYPIFSGDRLMAQLDIDSNKTRPFGPEDRKLIGKICEQIGEKWPSAGF